MLKKLNQKNSAGKDLYQNVQTGNVSTLAKANFTQSMRRTNLYNLLIVKKIFHFSPAALLRKEAVFNFYKSIEDGAAKFNKFLKINYGKA